MSLDRILSVPYARAAQISCCGAKVIVMHADSASTCDLVVTASEPQGRTHSTATLNQEQAVELRDALTEAIDAMPHRPAAPSEPAC